MPEIDYDHYRNKAHQLRSGYMRDALASTGLGPAAKRRLSLFAAAFVLATGAFWATMLTAPPNSDAGVLAGGISPSEIMRNAPRDLPSLQADAF